MSEYLLFQEDKRLERLNGTKNPLETLNKIIPWESFRSELERVRYKEDRKPQGRKAYDVVMMFKIMVLQGLYHFSDEDAEFYIIDRLSFQKFLGIEPDGRVPDARTIWLFREQLKDLNIHNRLFEQFNRFLEKNGYAAQGGQIVDATFVEVPRQRNARTDRNSPKRGGGAHRNSTSGSNCGNCSRS